jgi:endonuclease YncB( thermonuclease family)
MTGETWQVERVSRAVDGDTVRLVRRRVARLDSLEQITRDAHPDGASVRLVWLDTPERGHIDYRKATADLTAWIADAQQRGPLTVICYDGGAGWDRLLGDLLDADGRSASQHMMIECGWPAYQEDR